MIKSTGNRAFLLEAFMAKTYKDTPETLLEAILAMQTKLLDLRDEFESAELTYDAEMGDGRTITRANPFVQEYRALVKDFGVALKTYKEISDTSEASTQTLEDLRAKFKVV